MNTIKTITAALTAAAAFALPIHAANASEGQAVSISYADLNLASEAGQSILDRRIENAIEDVCGQLQGRPTFDSAVRKCQMQTRTTAMKSRDVAVANYGRTQLAQDDRVIRFAVR